MRLRPANLLSITLALILITSVISAQKASLGIPFGHNDRIASLHQKSDGILVSASPDGRIRQWDIERGKLIGNLAAGTPTMVPQITQQGIALSKLGWGNSDEEGHYNLYDLNANKALFCPEYAASKVYATSSSITADGLYYLSDSHLIPLCEGDERDLAVTPLPFDASGISPRGDFLFQIVDNTIYRWTYPEFSELPAIVLQDVNNNTDINDIEYHYSSNYLLYKSYSASTAGYDYQIWDANNGKKIANVSPPEGYILHDVHPSMSTILLAKRNGDWDLSFHRYNLQTEQIDFSYRIPADERYFHEYSTPAVYSADGKYTIIGGNSGKIYVLNYQNGALANILKGHTNPIQNISLTADDLGLYINKGDWLDRNIGSNMVYWSFAEGNEVKKLYPERDELYELLRMVNPNDEPYIYSQFSDNSKLIASPDRSLVIELEKQFSGNRLVPKVFDMSTGEIVAEIPLNPRESNNNYYCISASISSDNSMISLGYESGLIEVFKLTGEFICYLHGHVDKVSDLVFTKDNKRLISSSFDSKIKFWDLENVNELEGEELATLFVIDEDDWIVLGPNNLFDASPHAMNQMFYIVEKEGEKEIVELEQMKGRYYEPGLLQKSLGMSSVPMRSVEGFDKVSLYPKVKTKLSGNVLNISLEERSGGKGKLSLYINGKEVEADINANRASQLNIPLEKYNKYFLYENVISVLAYNEQESLNSGLISQNYIYESGVQARGWGDQTHTPLNREDYLDSKLYVLSIGTSNYTGTKMDLKYADIDAQLMAQAMQSAGGELFGAAGGVDVNCLTTTDTMAQQLAQQQIKWQFATKDNIRKAFEAISQQAKPQDLVIVFLSGHGKTISRSNQPMFHYLTHEVSEDVLADEKAVKNSTISSEELTAWLQKIPAYKQVLMIDACNSGKIIDDINEGEKELNSSQIRALDRMSDRTGLFLITGSAADKVSYEASSFGLGLLTYALLKGMSGSAIREDNSGSKMIDVVNLFQYAKDEVQSMATRINGVQRPELNFPLRAGSFDIGIYNENTTIPLPEEKPVFIRGSFQNKDTFEDDLALEEELEKKFKEESAKGIHAKYIFKNLSSFPNAYQVRGQYSVAADGNISLEVRLFQKGSQPIDLEISDSPNVSVLVKKINRAVKLVLEQ